MAPVQKSWVCGEWAAVGAAGEDRGEGEGDGGHQTTAERGQSAAGGRGRRVRLRQYWLILPLAGMTHRQLASLRHGPRLYVLVVGDEGTVCREIEDRRTPSGLDSHPACMCPGARGRARRGMRENDTLRS